MQAMVRAAYLLPALLVVGCTRIVYMPMPVPAGLTAPCVHEADPRTNGELLDAYQDARVVIAQCDERLGAIRNLNKGEK